MLDINFSAVEEKDAFNARLHIYNVLFLVKKTAVDNRLLMTTVFDKVETKATHAPAKMYKSSTYR